MIGEEIRKARRRAGLTQEEVAFRARIDRSYLSQVETDKYNVSLEMFLRICDAIGVSSVELLGRIESHRKGTDRPEQ